jgi:hypothetical protein
MASQYLINSSLGIFDVRLASELGLYHFEAFGHNFFEARIIENRFWLIFFWDLIDARTHILQFVCVYNCLQLQQFCTFAFGTVVVEMAQQGVYESFIKGLFRSNG